MNTIIILLVVIAMLVIYSAMFWYFVRTIIIMGKRSTLFAVLGFLFSPFVQAYYHLTHKDQMSLEDRRGFKRFWWSLVLLILVTIVGGAILGLTLSPEQMDVLMQFDTGF